MAFVPEGTIASQEQMVTIDKALAEGRTPEEQGRKYFPELKGKDAATVKIDGMYTRTLLRDGSSVACFCPRATVRAKASSIRMKEALNRLNEDLCQRAKKQGKAITSDEIGFITGPAPEQAQLQVQVPLE
ncbi:hypothetical protein [Luteolibacter sp. Populi]|uniref:hypothetical protein n=1 Tax=Luteolibacter sp. Populi TaxID=3230487 RepID=UPI003465FF4D